MTTLQILISALGLVAVLSLAALGFFFLMMGKQADSRAYADDHAECCCPPEGIVMHDCDGVKLPFCMNCGLYQPSLPEAATTSSPGAKDGGALGRPTEGRADAAQAGSYP